MSKKQYWLEEWERDLVHRILDHVLQQANASLDSSHFRTIDPLALRWFRDGALDMKYKFAPREP